MKEAGRGDLSGKVALVAGGSRGLGRAMALGFARAGADVAVASRKLAACEAVAKEIEAKVGDIIKIVRRSPTAKKSVFYRLVID